MNAYFGYVTNADDDKDNTVAVIVAETEEAACRKAMQALGTNDNLDNIQKLVTVHGQNVPEGVFLFGKLHDAITTLEKICILCDAPYFQRDMANRRDQIRKLAFECVRQLRP